MRMGKRYTNKFFNNTYIYVKRINNKKFLLETVKKKVIRNHTSNKLQLTVEYNILINILYFFYFLISVL